MISQVRAKKPHIIGQSHKYLLNECIVMSYYLLPHVNHHQQADLFSYHNYNDRLRLANQKLNTNYIISQQNVWNVEIANLTVLDVNTSASTQFTVLKLWESILIVLLYLQTKFWANLRHGQKFGQKAFNKHKQTNFDSFYKIQFITHVISSTEKNSATSLYVNNERKHTKWQFVVQKNYSQYNMSAFSCTIIQ